SQIMRVTGAFLLLVLCLFWHSAGVRPGLPGSDDGMPAFMRHTICSTARRLPAIPYTPRRPRPQVNPPLPHDGPAGATRAMVANPGVVAARRNAASAEKRLKHAQRQLRGRLQRDAAEANRRR
ncbi:hypothetical protein PMAYCL1PPCAC_01608, partial [Pristionchus mayeri]